MEVNVPMGEVPLESSLVRGLSGVPDPYGWGGFSWGSSCVGGVGESLGGLFPTGEHPLGGPSGSHRFWGEWVFFGVPL